jgi:C4-dicarboxylate-specific signal transduction histidine kinase
MRERLVLSCEHFYPPLGEWVENRMYPMPDGGLAMYVRYITDQKRAEEELHTTRAELAHALRVSMMGEMAASIAHEINQPLGAIVNNSNVCLQLVRKTGSVKKRREVLLDILNDAKRASAIINRIRALTKRSKPKKTSLSVKKLVIDVLAHADYAAVKAEVTIKTSVRTQLRVSGDQIQLQQMLLNLVMNGIEAMSDVDKKERTLSIRVKRGEVEGKPAAVISVQDGGPGLETKEVDRFFQPFFTTKRDGMGMGLGISRTIAEANGGRLWAIPNKAPGATFCCALPIEMETA